MRAARFHRFGPPSVVAVEQVADPKPRRGELLVRVHAAALNPKDVLVRAGSRFAAASRPLLPLGVAEDFAGVVERSPDPTLPVGSRVYGMLGYFRFGAAAELACAKREELAAMPASLDFHEAAAIPLVGLTSLQAFRDEAKLRAGERVLIHGASGGVGTTAVQVAKALGAHVTASCSAANHELVRSLGADATHDYRERAPSDLDARFDVFFDVYGNQPFPKARRVLTPSGRHVATVPGPKTFGWAFATTFMKQRARVVLVRPRRADLDALSAMVARGALRPVVDRRFALDEIVAAQSYLETKRARGKVVIDVA